MFVSVDPSGRFYKGQQQLFSLRKPTLITNTELWEGRCCWDPQPQKKLLGWGLSAPHNLVHASDPEPQLLHMCLCSRPWLCVCSMFFCVSGTEPSTTMKNHQITKEDSKRGRKAQKITKKKSQKTIYKIAIASPYLSIINLNEFKWIKSSNQKA